MEYKIRYTPQAMQDMNDVWEGVYEASKDYDTADRYIEDFFQEIKAKKKFPLSGIPLSYRGLFTGFYSLNFKKYKAFYRIKDNYIEIIRIIMSKKDYLEIIFNESDGE